MLKRAFFTAAKKNKKGQSLAEYALILALIAVACIAAMQGLSTKIQDKMNDIGSSIAGAK